MATKLAIVNDLVQGAKNWDLVSTTPNFYEDRKELLSSKITGDQG